MPDNQGLSHLSDHFLIVAVVLYSLAVIAFAADFAFGRRSTAAPQAGAGTPDLVPAGVAAGSGTAGSGATVSGASQGGASQGPAAQGTPSPDAGSAVIAATDPGRPGPGGPAAGHAGKGGQPAAPLSRLARIALILTTARLALHILGVITRGLAVHRVPWGDMYEFVISVTCVAVLFFIGLMIKYRPYYLGLFFMAPIVIILGAGPDRHLRRAWQPLVPALNSYWLAIHVTAMTLASGTFMVGAVLAIVYLFAERHTRRVAAGLSTRTARCSGCSPARSGPTRSPTGPWCSRSPSGPSASWPGRSGRTRPGAATGAGIPPRPGPRSPGWCTRASCTPASPPGWRGRRAAYIQLAGFCCLLFNLLGVSLFITGLHSYAGLS